MVLPCICRGLGAPHDAGNYNSPAWETGFFRGDGGNWDSDYGRFFLSWYSDMLQQHADRILAGAAAVLNQRGRPCRLVSVKQVRACCTAPPLKWNLSWTSALLCRSMAICPTVPAPCTAQAIYVSLRSSFDASIQASPFGMLNISCCHCST